MNLRYSVEYKKNSFLPQVEVEMNGGIMQIVSSLKGLSSCSSREGCSQSDVEIRASGGLKIMWCNKEDLLCMKG